MTVKPPLTARGVKSMLANAGVDYSELAIVDDPTVWTNLTTGQRGTSVVVSGPKRPRKAAWWALFERGLTCAPYPDRDEWSR